MQEPIEFTLHRKIKAGDMKAALLLSEELVKNVLFSQWNAGDALATERKSRPQASAGDVPLPLEEEPEKPVAVEVPERTRKLSSIPRKKRKPSKSLEEYRKEKGLSDVESLGKSYEGQMLTINGALAKKIAVEMYTKTHGQAPPSPPHLALFLGFTSPLHLQALNREVTQTSKYAEYLSTILGPEVLI